MTAQFNLSGINPGDYFIEVNDLAGDRVPTRIDSNESDINQSIGIRLRNSVIGNISDPTYRIKARLEGCIRLLIIIQAQMNRRFPS